MFVAVFAVLVFGSQTIIHLFGHAFGGDEAPIPIIMVLGQRIGLQHLFKAVASSDVLTNQFSGIEQHVNGRLQFGFIGQRAMAGDDFGFVIGHADHFHLGVHVAINAAA